MSRAGTAVIGAVGGCGATTMAMTVAASKGPGLVRVLALDGHGGGPHLALGVPAARGVDDLLGVRDEVDAQHVQQIAHTGISHWELVVGPSGPATCRPWSDDLAERLSDALIGPGPWVADLGRGDHVLAQAIARRAATVVLVMPRSLRGADAARSVLARHSGSRVVMAALARPGEPHISRRALRRLLGGADVIDVPWDRRGVDGLPAAAEGRRGLAAMIRRLIEAAPDAG